MSDRFNLLDFSKANIRTLHLTWLAFFVSFMVWFAHAPLMPFIREALQLTDLQTKVLLILNVTMTIPARILVGMLVDRYGPRILFSAILILGGTISTNPITRKCGRASAASVRRNTPAWASPSAI